MKKLFLLFLVLSIFSCKKMETITTEDKLVTKDPYESLYGNWVGDFVVSEADSSAYETDYVITNKVNLIIKKIENNRVYGQSIVAGNSRALVGDFTEYNGEYRFTMKEPGNRKNDGKFIFKIIRDTLKGNWVVNNKIVPVWERVYKLTKQPFRYDPKVMLPEEGDYIDYYSLIVDSVKYEMPNGEEDVAYSDVYRYASDIITQLNGSTTLLKESDVKNLKKLELEIIRNTIFARHGYTFKKKSFRQFFDPVDWYIPVTDNVSGKLTLIEQKNIVLLNRFQKYAEDNYDTFGR